MTPFMPTFCPLAQAALDAGQPPILVMIHRLQGLAGEETLSALLVLASFEQPIQLCLAGDAARSLFPSSNLGQQNRVGQMLRSLEYYDLLPVWCMASLEDPILPAEILSLDQLDRTLFAQVLTW